MCGSNLVNPSVEEQKEQKEQCQKDFELAQMIQIQDNYQSSHYNVLPPRRRNQPVHGQNNDIMILYHVTNPENGQKIKQSNRMQRSKQGVFGGGIYFAETAQDANYKAKHRGILVTCRVYVGKCLEVNNTNAGKFTFTSLYKKGYDSIWAPNGGVNGTPDRVIYNWDQVVIISVEKYEDKNVVKQPQKFLHQKVSTNDVLINKKIKVPKLPQKSNQSQQSAQQQSQHVTTRNNNDNLQQVMTINDGNFNPCDDVEGYQCEGNNEDIWICDMCDTPNRANTYKCRLCNMNKDEDIGNNEVVSPNVYDTAGR